MASTALRVELPNTLVAQLEERGNPEKEVARITRTYHMRTDMKPIVIGDEDRRRMEKIIGRNISSGAELITALERLTTITAGDVQVPLNERMLSRFRVLLPHKTGREFTDGVAKIVLQAIQNTIRAR